MNCEESGSLIMKYFDGEMNDMETARLKMHLKACSSCDQEFEALKGILDCSVLEKDNIEPPEDFEAGVMRRIEAYELGRRKRREMFTAVLYSSFTIAVMIMAMVVSFISRNVDIESIFQSFGPFSETAVSIYEALRTGYIFIAGIVGGLLKAVLTIAKVYYSIFALLTGMLILGYSLIARQAGRTTGEGT